MPYDIETESTESKSEKPVKRVRFSDEVQNFYDFAGSDENSGSVSVEDESNRTFINSPVGFENSEFYPKETIKDDENTDGETVSGDILRSISNTVNELPGCYGEEVNEIANSFTDDVVSQNSDSVADAEECNPYASNHITNDLDELIKDTMHMTISTTDCASSLSHILSSKGPSLYSSSSEAGSEKDTEVLDSEQKNDVTSLSRKRSLEGMIKGKQTAKLNTCLRKNKISSEISSANELKNAVYNAWYKVKNEKIPVPGSQFIPGMKKIDSSPKTTSNDAFETWKKSKRKGKKTSPTKKLSHKIPEPISGKTQEEIEESKMECS